MKFKTIIILAVSYILFISCGDVPVFTEMDTNRLKVVIKGTLETEDSSHFVKMESAIFTTDILDDSGEFKVTSSDLPKKFMFDIAELRLNGDKFANYRQVMEADLTDSAPFFSGKGIVLDNDDPAPGYYDTVQVYVRKMIFDGAEIYDSSGKPEPTQVIFHEEYVEGAFDFNQFQQNTYVDSLKLNARDYLRSFPIKIPIIGGLKYDKNDKETVLEIRFVIKNFIKKYELPFYDSGVPKLYHFYALSDWLRDVKKGDRVFGGNILAVARAYVPGKTGSVTVNVTGGFAKYVIAIPSDEKIINYYMPDRILPAPPTLPDADSGMRGFAYDLPQPPQHPGYRNIESLLDYYIKYEEYKSKWNDCISSMSPPDAFEEYADAWDSYNESVRKFKIAPYVGYSDGTKPVTFKNMAPGEYEFYTADPPSYGGFFSATDVNTTPLTYLGNSVIEVNIGCNITIP